MWRITGETWLLGQVGTSSESRGRLEKAIKDWSDRGGWEETPGGSGEDAELMSVAPGSGTSHRTSLKGYVGQDSGSRF